MLQLQHTSIRKIKVEEVLLDSKLNEITYIKYEWI